jgi:hypothetical protein
MELGPAAGKLDVLAVSLQKLPRPVEVQDGARGGGIDRAVAAFLITEAHTPVPQRGKEWNSLSAEDTKVRSITEWARILHAFY